VTQTVAVPTPLCNNSTEKFLYSKQKIEKKEENFESYKKNFIAFTDTTKFTPALQMVGVTQIVVSAQSVKFCSRE